jgi:hypothetical protein
MTAAIKAAPCSAIPFDDLMVCERCGLSWPAGGVALPCRPITLEDLRRRATSQAIAAEASLKTVCKYERNGPLPGDSAPARRTLAELNAITRLIDRVMGDPSIMEKLTAKK